MSNNLFESFALNTKTQWQEQAIKDLKGKDYDATLLWHSPEGITIDPFYSAESLEKVPLMAIQAAQKNKKQNGWQNRPIICYDDELKTNKLIISAFKNGATEIALDFGETNIEAINLPKLLDNVKLSETPVFFIVKEQCLYLTKELLSFLHYNLRGGIQDDFLATYMQTGQFPLDSWINTSNMIRLLRDSKNFSCITVGSHHFHNAGATVVQELAYTLATAVTYVEKLLDNNLTLAEIVPNITFSISIGTNYFMEIAKLRALKYLWSEIINHWANNTEAIAINCKIHCQTSTFYDAALTPNTNMLRASTEAMAAVIGGCDSLSIHAYDATFKSTDDFSERIAQNISIIMKEEAHLDKTQDPAAGSYYIEHLTNNLANASFELFLKIEKMGGILSAFEEGYIQASIEKSYNAKAEALKNGKIMVGVNKFRHDEVSPLLYQQQKHPNQMNGLLLLPNRRLSEIYETS